MIITTHSAATSPSDIYTYCSLFFFFFNDTATTEIYTLSLHDALPISPRSTHAHGGGATLTGTVEHHGRSEEHTSELQSRPHLVCRLLLEKKKKNTQIDTLHGWEPAINELAE